MKKFENMTVEEKKATVNTLIEEYGEKLYDKGRRCVTIKFGAKSYDWRTEQSYKRYELKLHLYKQQLEVIEVIRPEEWPHRSTVLYKERLNNFSQDRIDDTVRAFIKRYNEGHYNNKKEAYYLIPFKNFKSKYWLEKYIEVLDPRYIPQLQHPERFR